MSEVPAAVAVLESWCLAFCVTLVLTAIPNIRSEAQSTANSAIHWRTMSLMRASSGARHEPRFDPRPCPDDLVVPTNINRSSVSCGTVTVPQDREHPNAKLAPVVLPVVVYAAESARNRTPLLFLAGGPGEPAIEIVTETFLATPVGQVLVRERPVIAFNQRGFGPASSGTSPALGPLVYRPHATRSESIQSISDSARSLAGRLRKEGVEPRFFTTLHAVDDVPDVLHALGYERVVLFGTSYGTRMALQIMRTHGDIVEAAILDGVAPPKDTNVFSPDRLGRSRRAVASRVVADCFVDASCRSEYQDLQTLATAMEQPAAPMLHRVINLPSVGGWYAVDLNSRDVLSAIGAYAGTEPARASIPQLLEELGRGDTLRRPFSPQLVLDVVHESALSNAAGPVYPAIYHVVVCGDTPDGVLQAGGRPVCDALGVPFDGPNAMATVTSDVPTLLLSSTYDAQTPPELAEEAAKTLSRSHRVVFPGVGHLAYERPISGPCVAVIAQSFLLDPQHAPPDQCATSLRPSFLPRSADAFSTPP